MSEGLSWMDIHEERMRQDAKWGGADHDDKHSGLDWQRFIVDHAERGHWLHVAALGVATADALSRLQGRYADLKRSRSS